MYYLQKNLYIIKMSRKNLKIIFHIDKIIRFKIIKFFNLKSFFGLFHKHIFSTTMVLLFKKFGSTRFFYPIG